MSMSGDKVRIALDFVCVPRGAILYTFYRYARGE